MGDGGAASAARSVIHVDPRFTRTSAMANTYVPIRAGSDIAFLGGIVNYILEHGREFREYVVNYTNAPVIIDEEFKDTEDLDGSSPAGIPRRGKYDNTSWQYAGMEMHGAAGQREMGATQGEARGHGGARRPAPPRRAARGGRDARAPALRLPAPEEALRALHAGARRGGLRRARRSSSSRSPRRSARTRGASGRRRSSTRSAGRSTRSASSTSARRAIIQLLLGNIGRPGGGVMALRGHASIQGSTDIPTLYNILPGYIPMPHAHAHEDLDEYIDAERVADGLLGEPARPTWSACSRRGGATRATEANDFCFDYLPRITGDHSAYQSVLGMLDGKVKGYLLLGENPAVGNANSRLHRLAMAKLDWLVVRDFIEIESAAFWKDGPEIETGELVTEGIPTEVFFLPAATHVEKDGSFTNTQRLLQWHFKAVEPEGDCRSDLWFAYHLGRLIREKLAESEEARDRPLRELTWDYPTAGRDRRAERRGGAARDQRLGRRRARRSRVHRAEGRRLDRLRLLDLLRLLRGRGEPAGAKKTPGQEQTWVAPEWGWAWPMNRRILYNRASADPEGKPWSERKRYVWWDERAGQVDGRGRARLRGDEAARLRAARRRARAGRDPRRPPVHHAGRRPRLALRAQRGRRRAAADALRAARVAVRQPALLGARESRAPGSSRAATTSTRRPSDDAYPYVLTTYRLTEHHTAGGMSRTTRVPVGAAAGVLLRGQPGARGRARARARRLGDDRLGADGCRGARPRHRADEASDDSGPDDAPGRAFRITGARRGS